MRLADKYSSYGGGTQLPVRYPLLARYVQNVASVLDFLLVWSGMLPLLLLQGAFGWQVSRVIEASCNLGILDCLSKGEKSDAEIAKELGLNIKGTHILLQCLSALGHIEKRGETRYRLSRRMLQSRDPQAIFRIQRMLKTTQNLRSRWIDLEKTIRVGKPEIDSYQYFSVRQEEHYAWQIGMAMLADTIAPYVAAKTKLKQQPTSLLDLGGSHAIYSSAFRRRFPGLQTTVVDTVYGVPIGVSITNAKTIDVQTNFVVADIWKLPLGVTYDLILIFNILHANDDAANMNLLVSAREHLSNSGRILVLDQFIGNQYSRLGDLIASLSAMNLFNEMGGQAYSMDEFGALCKNSSLSIVQEFAIATAPGCMVFVLSTVPD